MINCIIVDDEQHSIDILKHHVAQTDYLNLLLATTNVTEALQLINTGTVDLLFQDVQMPEISGIEVVQAINGRCKVILTTAYEKYALDGYDLNVTDFLLKPISFPRFIKAVQKVVEAGISRDALKTEPGADFIYVKTGVKNSVNKIVLSTIEYIESVKNYVTIHHGGKKTLVYISMKELEASLPPDQFIRVHKSFIIPYAGIEGIDGGLITIRNSRAEIFLGDTYKTAFWEQVRKRTIG